MTIAFYKDTGIQFEEIEGQPCATAQNIGEVLGYKNADEDIQALYQRHQDEFDPDMIQEVPVITAGGVEHTRLFSLRGVSLLVMLSEQQEAGAFRERILSFTAEQLSRMC
ncbi:BRO family protein [Oceanospirillum sediminis]|uniref:Bro-N domain-containing protein n=1 Tax=Oceanospirillum sediminis TaxID=2760088 RepID=A0A839IWN2_9GAMM|nr:BRO family protein [Oceanospirillum sediminis]MBB1489371.1 hypothetical protein [Oceanospirillum sediminis]